MRGTSSAASLLKEALFEYPSRLSPVCTVHPRRALSHPNIVQAYTCMTDVLVRELLSQCLRSAHPMVLASSAYKYLASMEDRTCHIEVIEYCDLGNMSTALKSAVFQVCVGQMGGGIMSG